MSRLRNAMFFSVDGVVRRVSTEAGLRYADQFGMAPPVPPTPKDQELILPVVKFIKDRCDEWDAVPIAIDMAPYLGSGQLSIEQYTDVADDLLRKLDAFGVKGTKFYYCGHVPKEVLATDPMTGMVAVNYVPNCECRMPNTGLILQACVENKIRTQVDGKKFRVVPPSAFLGNSQPERDCSIMGCGMNYIHLEAVLDGTYNIAERVDASVLSAVRAAERDVKKLMRENSSP